VVFLGVFGKKTRIASLSDAVGQKLLRWRYEV